MDIENLKYPIGKFNNDKTYSFAEIMDAKAVLAAFPEQLNNLCKDLSDSQLDTPYRPGGWTARQVVHHIADSHIHMYTRVKFAMTEENPTIKGYDEEIWANLPDSKLAVHSSLLLIEGIHTRLVALLDTMTEVDFKRTFFHGGYNREYVLNKVIPLYGWHSSHHYEHIKIAAGL